MYTQITFIIAITFLFVPLIQASAGWTYKGKHGKSTWGDVATLCETGMHQSPIDLTVDESHYVNKWSSIGLSQQHINDVNRPRSKVNRKDTDHAGMYLFNNGHSVQVNIHENIMIEGGGLEGKFKVAQLHFHWGQGSDRGSEHQRNGKPFPMEMHIVAYDSSRFSDLSSAVGQVDSLAVVAVFFRVAHFDNPHLNNIVDNMHKVHKADGHHKVHIPLMMVENLLPVNRENFYRYHGSLTTPGCQESVIWTVMDMPNYVSERQLNQYRRLLQYSGDYLEDNYRNVQDINHREVQRSFPHTIDYIIIAESNEQISSSVAITASLVLVITSLLGYLL